MVAERGKPSDGREPAEVRRTVLALLPAGRLSLFVGFPVGLGLLLAVIVPYLAEWTGDRPSMPVLGNLARLLAGIDGPREIVAVAAAGAVLGFFGAVAVLADSPKVTLTDGGVCIDQDGRNLRVPRSEVTAVFIDGTHLVVQDRESRQLVSKTRRAAVPALARTFRAYGYPWVDRDPYTDLYRRWESDNPDLPPLINDILAARQVALHARAGRNARVLRDAVQEIGFAVRDDGSRQYWRVLVRSS